MHCSARLWHNTLVEQRGCSKIHYLKFLFLFLTRFHAALFLSSCSFFFYLLFWGFCVWQFFSIAGFVLFVTLFLPSWAPHPPFSVLCVGSLLLLFCHAVICFTFLSFSALLSHIMQKNKFSFCRHSFAWCYVVVSFLQHRCTWLWMCCSFWFQESQTHVQSSAKADDGHENNQSNQENCSLRTMWTSFFPVD